MSEKVRKYEFTLSEDTDVYIIFNGAEPTKHCFGVLRRMIDLMEFSLNSALVPKLPCRRHPESGRHEKTNRCLDCLAESANNMNIKRRINGNGNANHNTPTN